MKMDLEIHVRIEIEIAGTSILKQFCSAAKEYWMGLRNMNILTNRKRYQLRVLLTDANSVRGVGYYGNFSIGGIVRLSVVVVKHVLQHFPILGHKLHLEC